MRKLFSIILLLLLTTVSSYAGKAKPGSGPINFNEKELKDFHIYITKKLNGNLIKELRVEGYSFNRSGTPFYANHFIIRADGYNKSIFQWDNKNVNIGPEKGLCSSPGCKIFAKKIR